MSFSFFSLINLFFVLGTSFWLVKIYVTERYLFVKPSIILLTYTHVFFQWPMVLLSSYCENKLQNPYILSFLINGYMLLGLFLSPLILKEKTKIIWNRLTSKSNEPLVECAGVSVLMLTLSVISIAFIYFSYVPFNKTGLYAVYSDPSGAALAREKSLKLLDSQGIKYLYSLARSSVIPILFSCIWLRLLKKWKYCHFNTIVTYFEITILMLSFIFVAITGEKAFLAYLMLLGGLIIFWKDELKFQPIKIIFILFLSFLLPIILILWRAGGVLEDFSLFFEPKLVFYYASSIIERSVFVPFKVGVWYVRYAQDIGPMGIASFEKLSQLFGVSPINASNIIGLKYAPEYYGNAYDPRQALKSISAGGGYLLSYYGYLGIVSFPISVLGLLALDLSLFVYIRLKDQFLIPCLASISIVSLAFIQGDYTVCLITHGFIGVLLLSFLLSFWEDYFSNILNIMRYSYARK